MEEKSREMQASEVLRAMRIYISEHEQEELIEAILEANGDKDKLAKAAQHVSTYQVMLPTRDWEEGMATKCGDIVFDPERHYRYVFTHPEPYQHTNAMFYPGAEGIDYWLQIPLS